MLLTNLKDSALSVGNRCEVGKLSGFSTFPRSAFVRSVGTRRARSALRDDSCWSSWQRPRCIS